MPVLKDKKMIPPFQKIGAQLYNFCDSNAERCILRLSYTHTVFQGRSCQTESCDKKRHLALGWPLVTLYHHCCTVNTVWNLICLLKTCRGCKAIHQNVRSHCNFICIIPKKNTSSKEKEDTRLARYTSHLLKITYQNSLKGNPI